MKKIHLNDGFKSQNEYIQRLIPSVLFFAASDVAVSILTLYFTLNPVKHGFVVFKINTLSHRDRQRQFSFPRLRVSRLLYPYYEREVAEKAEVEMLGTNPHKQTHTDIHTYPHTYIHTHTQPPGDLLWQPLLTFCLY